MQIEEEHNKNIVLKKVKMNTDEPIKGLEKPLQSYGFFYMIIGPPKSGKTNLLVNLITTRGKYYYKKYDRIEFFSPSRHTIGKKIKLPDERFHDELNLEELAKCLDTIEPETKVLFIFDDCVAFLKKNSTLFLNMIFNRRHYHGANISICIVSQVFNKIPLELRKACSGLFFFKNTNKEERTCVFNDFATMAEPHFKKLCKYVFTTPHDFLYIDTTNETYYKNFNKLSLHFDDDDDEPIIK